MLSAASHTYIYIHTYFTVKSQDLWQSYRKVENNASSHHLNKVFCFFRKRFLNFLSSFDLIDLPMRKLFNVLTKNLRVAEGLVYVHQYNAVSWQQELQFICGDQDLLQWQVGHWPGDGAHIHLLSFI